jgi:hypothetical protein
MHVCLWIVQSLLAVAFAASGVVKTTKFREQLRSQLPWVSDVPAAVVRPDMTTATDLSGIDAMSFDPHSACLVEAFRDALVRMRDGEDLTVEDLDTAADLLQLVQATKGDFLAAEVMPLFREVFQGGRDGGAASESQRSLSRPAPQPADPS